MTPKQFYAAARKATGKRGWYVQRNGQIRTAKRGGWCPLALLTKRKNGYASWGPSAAAIELSLEPSFAGRIALAADGYKPGATRLARILHAKTVR